MSDEPNNTDSRYNEKVIRFPGLTRPTSERPAGEPEGKSVGRPAKVKGEASGAHRTLKDPSGAHRVQDPSAATGDPSPLPGSAGPDGLTEDQRKAISLILGGVSFVLVGMKPTDRGADFFTAVHGDATDLRNAQPHLASVIDRAFSRKGI